MSGFQMHKKASDYFYIKPVLFILLALFILLSLSLYNVYGKYRQVKQKRDIAKQAVLKSKIDEATMMAKVESLKTQQGIENYLRSQYPVAKPGEQVILITDSEHNIDIENKPNVSFIDKLKNMFKNKK
ncbi:MAG: septum formation initiator family protein [Minisyncoccia bacterium]